MALALEVAGVGVQEMADYLGVDRGTVGRWINGRGPATKQTLRLWALRTGVSLDWLETGLAPAGTPGPDGECAARDSNPEPASKELALVIPLFPQAMAA